MDSVSADTLYLIMWALFASVPLILGAAFFTWGLRNRQFSDPGRCARLPLESPGNGSRAEDCKKQKGSSDD